MSTKRELKKLDFSFSKEQLQKFIDKLSDLSAIDDYIVFKIDKKNFLIYTVASDPSDKNNRTILAFKSYTFDLSEIINIKNDLDEQIVYILKDTKKTLRNIRNFIEFDEIITCSITYDSINDINFGDCFKLKNSKLRLNFQGGSPRDSNIKISTNAIKEKSTPELMLFDFNITKEDFDKAKKLALIEVENDVIYFVVHDKELSIAENRWALKLCDFTYKDKSDVDLDINICIPKRFFKTATCDDKGLNVKIFQTHIIMDNEKSSLMISRQISLN
jgi:hypothetical protein